MHLDAVAPETYGASTDLSKPKVAARVTMDRIVGDEDMCPVHGPIDHLHQIRSPVRPANTAKEPSNTSALPGRLRCSDIEFRCSTLSG